MTSRIVMLAALVSMACACSTSTDRAVDGGASVDASPLRVDGGPPLAHPAPRPAPSTEGPDDAVVFFALKEIVLDQGGDRWRTIGYDLDDLDSQPPTPMVECYPPRRTASLETDGVDGVDNAFGHTLAPLLITSIPALEPEIRANEHAGLGAVLVEIRNWNGLDDDPQVDVRISQSVRASPDPPRWDGADAWSAGDDAFLDGDPERPFLRDDAAYVAGRLIVAHVPDRWRFTFTGATTALEVRLTAAVVTGRISADGQRLEDFTLAGRWSVADFLDTLERAGICRDTAQYNIVSNLLMTAADVRSVPGTGGPGVVCDALSFATVMQGYRASFGGVVPAIALPSSCP